MLINGYVEHHKVGWDFEDESPGRDARGFAHEGAHAARDRDAPRQHGAHERRALLRRPRAPRVLHARVPDALELVCADKAGERILARSMHAASRLVEPGPGDRRLQEQLRRQGQLVRHPRELPRRPGGAVRGARAQPAAVVRHAARCSPARARSAPRTAAAPSTTRSASEPTSSKRRSGSRPR